CFIGSILCAAGGALQSWLAWPEQPSAGGGGAAWWAAIIQSAGTLFFNLTTYQAMHTALTSPEVQQARLAARLARRDLLPRLRRDRLPRLVASSMVAGARRRGLVVSRQSTFSAAFSSESRLSPATSFRRPGRCSTRRRPTGTHRWARHASWPVLSTPCTATGPRRCH